jgi:intraflagellar transport protein 80
MARALHACAQVLFGQLVHREVSCGHLEVRQEEAHSLTVVNVTDDAREDLQFKDRVTEMSLSASHLLVITATQACIYSTNNWNTPHIVELRGTVSLILQTSRHFLMVDTINGLQVLNYDGRVVSQPKFAAMRPDALSTMNVGYAPDLIAVIGHADPKIVFLLDPLTGKQLGTVQHTIDIEQVALSQRGGLEKRRLVVVDKNRDLYLTPVQGAQELHKLHIMVDSVAWNVESDALAAVADGQLLVWFYPEVVYMDRELLPLTLSKQTADWGKTAEIVEFRETRITVRRSDGATVCAAVSPYPSILEKFCATSEWEPALRLCRYVKSNELWACLAAMAIAGKELHTAEVAYAAIEQVDKLLYMCHIKELPTIEAREAELLLFRRRMPEALQVLVQGGWIYRAIKMCIRLYQWEKAYDLARQHQQHVDTVLLYRQKYLTSHGAAETLPKLEQAAAQMGPPNEEAIRAKIDAEKERERERGGQAAAGA